MLKKQKKQGKAAEGNAEEGKDTNENSKGNKKQ